MSVNKTEIDLQIRFADIDILGHVNNVNLQHYFDVGKNDYFRRVMNLGFVWDKLGLITAATNTSYFAQTRPSENIYVETSIEKVGTKSLTILQRIISRDNGEVKAESRSVLVAFDFEQQASFEIPQAWRQAIGETQS